MKKRNIKHKTDDFSRQNPVAKFAHRFNRAQTFTDKSKYSRKLKQQRPEIYPIIFTEVIG